MIANEDNLGFAQASNMGIEHALGQGADYVLLLNNDTLVDGRLLTELVTVGQSDPQIGMLVPKIYRYGEEARLWSAGARWRRFPPRVTIVGFGTFSVVRKKARKGRNPQTGAPIKIAARKVPKFSAGSGLRKAVK